MVALKRILPVLSHFKNMATFFFYAFKKRARENGSVKKNPTRVGSGASSPSRDLQSTLHDGHVVTGLVLVERAPTPSPSSSVRLQHKITNILA